MAEDNFLHSTSGMLQKLLHFNNIVYSEIFNKLNNILYTLNFLIGLKHLCLLQVHSSLQHFSFGIGAETFHYLKKI